ncbi:unnamed protein product, partial [Discosporangium mesarthrocarpum]
MRAGNDAFAKKDYEEATRLYSEAIDLDPENHVYHSNLSACHALKGDHRKAALEARECIRLDPAFVKGYYRLATAQTELGELDEALATVGKGLAKDPSNGDLLRQQRMLRAKRSSSSPSLSNSAAQRGSNQGRTG